MLAIDRERAQRAFEAYAGRYDLSDPKIAIKAEHTFKVAALCDRVARSVGLDGHDTDLAWLAGLLHDVGRFEQVRRFHTFDDARSTPHAALGVRILFDEGLLADFAHIAGPAAQAAGAEALGADPDARALREAVACHSDFALPEGLDPRTLALCQILRDADKVDILRAICEADPCDVLDVSREELLGSTVSPAVAAAFEGRRTVLRADRATPADHLVSHACLVFGLVYPESRRAVLEQGFVFKLFEVPYTNPGTAALVARMGEQMRAWLGVPAAG